MELQKIYSENKGALIAFAESRIGGRKENQDSYGWKNTKLGYLVTVCDGMGGGPGGKTASTIAVNEIIAGVSESSNDEETSNIIIKAIRRANMAIIEAANENHTLKGMGSTATVILISEKSAFIAHVGDSRVYQIRNGKKKFRTFDHSMVFEMVEQGVITEEQARLSAQSNVITRALGVKPDVKVDIKEVSYNKGDRFLLCTDGIHGTMPESELIKMVANRKNKLGVLTDDIATYVDNLGMTSGGRHDNLTLAIIEMNIDSKLRTKMSKQTKTTLALLVCLLFASITINIIQHKGKTNNITISNDSIQAMKSKLNKQDTTIIKLKKAMKDIDTQVSQISRSNISPTDSISKIIKENI